jgi:FkbM family methyltransferase
MHDRLIFIDLGTNNGESIEQFWQNTGHFYEKRSNARSYHVHGFEPNADHYKLKEKYANNDLVHIYADAAWIHYGVVQFKNAPSSLSSCVSDFTMQCYDESYATIEKVPCIDYIDWFQDFNQPNDYTVVKMDIESSEYTLIPKMLLAKQFLRINEFYVEFHHTYPSWESVSKSLLDKIRQQCPTIVLRPWF